MFFKLNSYEPIKIANNCDKEEAYHMRINSSMTQESRDSTTMITCKKVMWNLI